MCVFSYSGFPRILCSLGFLGTKDPSGLEQKHWKPSLGFTFDKRRETCFVGGLECYVKSLFACQNN